MSPLAHCQTSRDDNCKHPQKFVHHPMLFVLGRRFQLDWFPNRRRSSSTVLARPSGSSFIFRYLLKSTPAPWLFLASLSVRKPSARVSSASDIISPASR